MALKKITVRGFKSLAEVEDLELGPLNILLGANGAGKSNFISLFALLNRMVAGHFQVAVQKAGGANALLHFGEKTTKAITVHLDFGRNQYSSEWTPTADDSLQFEKESVYFQGQGYPQPYGKGLGSGHRESKLPEAARSARGIAKYVLKHLQSWRVYHFHDTSDSAPVKKTGDANDNEYLRPDASNLAAFLLRLRDKSPEHYQGIRDAVRLVAPFFDDFVLREHDDRIRLEWQETGSDYPFLAHYLSDGTLRFMCLATLLLQPDLPATILIDEPELGLHPYAINVLASLMRSASQRTQLIVSTQSVPLVDQLDPSDLVIVDRQGPGTVMRRLDQAALQDWLEEYSLGELWEKNVFGGRPSR